MRVFSRNLPMTEQINNLWFCFVAVTCEFRYIMSHSLWHPCYHSYNYRFYRVIAHLNYFALLFCEVRSVNFLKSLKYLREDCLEEKMKQINEVGIESDR